jgi:hypothetical protein
MRVILEQVQDMGASDATEPSPMLDALLSMAECGPDICEAFFTPLPTLRTAGDGGPEAPRQCDSGSTPGDLFGMCLEMLSTTRAPVASQLSRILVVVVQTVGLGVAGLRQMIGWFHGGRNARQVLACMNQMAQLDRRDAPTRTEPSCFFVLNGAQSGLYMGGDSECAACASTEHRGGTSAALDALSTDAAPWATFALNVARQYAAAHRSSAACSPLTCAALHLAQYSTHRDIYHLSGGRCPAPQAAPAKAYGARAGDICQHHRERGQCVDCLRELGAAESAADKSLRMLKEPLAQSLATLSDFYAPDAEEEEEEEKQRRYKEEEEEKLRHSRQLRAGGQSGRKLQQPPEHEAAAHEAAPEHEAAAAAVAGSVAPDEGSPAAPGRQAVGREKSVV